MSGLDLSSNSNGTAAFHSSLVVKTPSPFVSSSWKSCVSWTCDVASSPSVAQVGAPAGAAGAVVGTEGAVEPPLERAPTSGLHAHTFCFFAGSFLPLFSFFDSHGLA